LPPLNGTKTEGLKDEWGPRKGGKTWVIVMGDKLLNGLCAQQQ